MATVPSSPPPSSSPSGAECWREAQKWRRAVKQKLELLQKNEGSGKEDVYLEASEDALKIFRLGCMTTVFADFAFAASENVDKILWQVHGQFNNEYRKILANVGPKASGGNHKAIMIRQVQKMYAKFLRTSLYFYKGYVQRLAARYEVPELERIAGRLETPGSPLENVPRENDPKLAPLVLRACHAALLNLGDLARYRRQADRKSHQFDAPLVYYRLAHEILPSSGHGHHQMAVVYIGEEGYDLPVVYHLYRSLAVAEPYPVAVRNLEHWFKKMPLIGGAAKVGQASRNASLDPRVTLATWFVRLQAIYYKGDSPGPQQEELEREVLHRTRVMCSTKGSRELLLDMALTNIAAYYVAHKRANNEWTFAVSRSSQYFLNFNVRTILAISRALSTEIEEALKSAAAPAPKAEQDASPRRQPARSDASKKQSDSERFETTFEIAIPLLRIYMIWLCMHRVDLVKYGKHLSPHLTEMHQSLANTLSTIIELFRNDALGTGTSPYMLPEDIETVSFEPLNKTDVAMVCRAMHLNRDGKPKPRLGDSDAIPRRGGNDEALSRINDIINCALFLGTDPRYPLRATPAGNRVLIQVVPLDAEQTMEAMSNPNHVPAMQPRFEQLKPTHSVSPALKKVPSLAEPEGPAETEFGVDGETLDRLNDFLTPPEVNSPQSTAHDDSSYGMHSSKANDVFGAPNPIPNPVVTTPTSATAKAFPALPWALFYTPKPYRPDLAAGPGGNPGSAAGPFVLPRPKEVQDGTGLAPAASVGSPLSRKLPTSLSTVTLDAAPAIIGRGFAEPRMPRPRDQTTTREISDKKSSRMEQLRNASAWNCGVAPEATTGPAILPSAPMQSRTAASPAANHAASSCGNVTPPHLPSPQAPTVSSFVPPVPFFQSSNFTQDSSIPQLGSPWSLPAAAIRQGATIVNARLVPGPIPAAPPPPSSFNGQTAGQQARAAPSTDAAASTPVSPTPRELQVYAVAWDRHTINPR